MGKYLFSNVGFSTDAQPFLSLSQNGKFTDLLPLGKTLTLRFDKSQRWCVGWRDITTGERFVCPLSQKINEKYEQCTACQQRTGFNPAFYNATSISKQQEARNSEPHILYLAHFGADIVKVGISHAQRGNSRLLEQGARSALVLDTFPTALIAREYEARIANLPDIVETVQLRKKIDFLSKTYDSKRAQGELLRIREYIEQTIAAKFARNDVIALDSFYFPIETPPLHTSHDATDQHTTSGKVIGMLGSLLFCQQQDTPIFLPLKKYMGYSVTLSYKEVPMTLPAQQISLFDL